MDDSEILKALQDLRNKTRNFNQAVDLIVSLKGLDLKKPEHQIDVFVALPNPASKKVKVCALVAQELASEAKEVCDAVVLEDDFDKYSKDKKALKRLIKEHDYFIGQSNIMPKIANSFGRVLGPKGKMPNPKAGCVIPPKSSLKPFYSKLQATIRVSAKTSPVVQCKIGDEQMGDEKLAQNFRTIYDQIVNSLPNGEANVKTAFLKLTMGRPVMVK